MKTSETLRLLKILVNETTEEHPLSEKQIVERCEKEGFVLYQYTFRNNLKILKDAGIRIDRRKDMDGDGWPCFLYWYADGWI